MNDLFSQGIALVMAKIGTIMASLSMAVIAVSIDAKRHNWLSAILAIIAGTVTGVIAASAIVALMGWPEQTGYGVASVFAIAGDRLVKWIMRMADDPASLLNLWRGKK